MGEDVPAAAVMDEMVADVEPRGCGAASNDDVTEGAGEATVTFQRPASPEANTCVEDTQLEGLVLPEHSDIAVLMSVRADLRLKVPLVRGSLTLRSPPFFS